MTLVEWSLDASAFNWSVLDFARPYCDLVRRADTSIATVAPPGCAHFTRGLKGVPADWVQRSICASTSQNLRTALSVGWVRGAAPRDLLSCSGTPRSSFARKPTAPAWPAQAIPQPR